MDENPVEKAEGSGRVRHHWRSMSWCGHSSNPSLLVSPDLDFADNGVANVDANTGGEEDDNGDNGLCPPLQSLVVSPKKHKERSKLIAKIRNGVGMRLDLDAVEKASQELDEGQQMVECERECSRILPFLFLGGKTVAQSLATLRSCRITHILNCVGFVCPEYFPNDFFYKTLWLQDSPSEDISCILYDVFDYIEDIREQASGRVFIHCCQGVSRSAALVIAYLMWSHRCHFEDAFDEVKFCRAVANPNMGFVFQLMQWQSRILSPPPSDKHFIRMYRVAPHSTYDPLHLVSKVVNTTPVMRALDSRGAFVIQVPNRLYVWRGRHCDKEMAAAADRSAFQLVRYEYASGPIVSVTEGNEPIQLQEVLRRPPPENNSEDSLTTQEGISLGEMEVSAYDSDYEMYRKAKLGGYVPPVIGPGAIIHLPAQNEKWSRLRSYAGPRSSSDK